MGNYWLFPKVAKNQERRFGIAFVIAVDLVRLEGTILEKKATSCGCETYDKVCYTRGLSIGDSQFNALYSSYKSNAKRKNLSFLLSKEVFRFITLRNCYYCGKPPSEVFRKSGLKGVFVYNGVDRKDSMCGYTYENCLPCCTDCNYMKSNIHHDQFLDKINMIYKNLILKRG